MINSPFGDGTRSWVRIVNGKCQYVAEMSEEIHIEDIGESAAKPVAKARPKQTPSSMSSSTTIQVQCQERKWTDVIRQKLSGSIEIDDQIGCDMMRQYLEKMTEHSISKTRQQYFVQNLRLLRSNMAEFLAKMRWHQEEIPRLRGSQFT